MINGKHALILGNACRIFFILLELAPFSAVGMALTFGDCVALPKAEIGYSIQSSHMVAPPPVQEKGFPITWTEYPPFPLFFLPLRACPGCPGKQMFY